MRTFGGSVTHVPKTVAMTIQVSTTGGAVLNPEATVFQLPPTPRSPTHSTPTPAHASATPAPAPTPTPTPAHINGFHSNVDPFMNGDVGLECCGVDCPATPEDCPASVGALGGATPLQGDAPPKAAPAKALSGATEAAPLQTPSAAPPQQNGEVTAGVAGQGTASPAPTPPAAPQSPTPPSPAPMEAGQAGQGGQGEGLAPGSETQATQTTPTQTPSPASPPGSPPGTPAATPAPGQMAPPPPPQQPLSREQIKQLVAQQVEYFFSRENLSSDPYLISQMDSDQYVPVYILANCTQFKTITKDHSIIVEALKESPFVQLDEERNRVRPNYKRCIVILREIPESTPIEEIESVFKSDECPKVVSCEFVHNSSWYVTFESDEDAQKAYWYLRGVVKTFKDKPILARIKTKPISRLGCLSVLPSYGGKAGGGTEAKEGQGSGTAPPSAQPSPSGATGGARSGAGTQAAAGNYGSSGGRFLFSTHQSVNPGSYTYTYTPASSPMPTAYFYPNVMQWTPPPGGFYDINSFLQFNGLSPQGTFTPHNPGPTLRYPPNRRNPKHRDNNRYDKDSRHNTTTTATTTPNQTPHYQRQHHHHHHRPHPTPSPSQPQPQHQQHRPPSRAPPSAAPTPPPPPPPNMESFAQNDISLASQSGLYTSFSPPATVEKEVVTVSTTNTTSTPLGKISTPSTSPTHSPPPVLDEEQMQPPPPPPQPPQPPLPPPPHLHQPPHMHPRHHHHHHHHHHQFPPPHHLAQGLPGPPPPPPPHRHGTYPPDHFHHHHHPPHLHQQGPRPVFDDRHPYYHRPRNPRRRPRGREEEMLAGPGRGGPPQRTTGAPHQPPGSVAGDVGKQATPTPQEGSPAPPPPPPQFDLEAASFPPLPSTDEPAVVVVERRSNDPLPSAWGETQPQRFSDIMKGNPKPRPPSITDTPTDTPPTPTSATATQTPPTTTVTPTAPATAPTTATAATTPSQTPTTTTTTTTPPPSTTIDDHNHHHQTTTTTTTATTPATAPAPTPATAPPPAPAPKQDPRPARDQRLERRPVGVGAGAGATPNGATNGPRERREFPREYPQRGQAGREFRGNRDPTLRAGKENRPIRSREDRMDADGWITKGSRESRAQRETREQWERGESSSSAPRHHYNNNNNNNHHYHHNHHLVNGDSASPPPSPKPQKGESKLGDDCTDAAKGVSGRPLNNNDGEHKTTWAKMALASKDHMERLAAELKEKEEQEKIKKQRLATRPPPRPQEKVVAPRERDGKMVRRDALPREPRGLPGERGGPIPFRPRDAATPKSPK